MRHVLDDDLITGVVAAETHLRPARGACMLDTDDWNSAETAVTRLSQLWGGATDLLVPVAAGVAPDPYPRLLRESELDGATGTAASSLAPNLSSALARRLPAMLTLGLVDHDRSMGLEVSDLQIDNPWRLSYLATLGTLPEHPSPDQLSGLLLRETLEFGEFVRVERQSVATPSASDLVARLRKPNLFTPIGMSLSRLRTRPIGTKSAALDGWLNDRYAFARNQGPSIVILYTPNSVTDLCLTWNLRALHGWPAGLPLAVPYQGSPTAGAEDVITLLDHANGGISGWPVLLVSATVPHPEVAEIASVLVDRRQIADAVQPHDVLQPARPATRTTATSLVFDGGAAMVATRTDRDRQDLGILTRIRIPAEMRLTVGIAEYPLPPSASLFGGPNSAFGGGGCIINAGTDKLAKVHWPTGFTVLRAVAHDYGVDAAPSASGRTAMALLRALGSVNDIVWLANRPLIDLLYKKAASSGMGWWKKRATMQAEIVANASGDPAGTEARLLQAIQEVSVSHGGESAATLTFSELNQAIGSTKAASVWLKWAERRSLLVRGSSLKCVRCQYRGWRPLADMAPPIVCPGCGTANDRPFQDASLLFSYRLGEVLRRAIENDSLYHLLVMRALAFYLDSGPDELVGVHPGVDFTHAGQQAEADIVAILASGMIIPVEVKMRSSGLRDHDLKQMDVLAQWLDVTTIMFATGDADSQLAPAFVAVAKSDATPIRRLLTAEDWLNPHPFVTYDTRQPGPDVSQDEATPPSRTATALDLDGTFADRLSKYVSLDAAADPTATRLGPQV